MTRRSPVDVPGSMRAELGERNHEQGVDLRAWIGREGGWALAIGFATFVWPEFESVEGHVLRKGIPCQNLNGFEEQPGATQQFIEWMPIHVHLLDLHPWSDASADKFLVLGNIPTNIYRAKLAMISSTTTASG